MKECEKLTIPTDYVNIISTFGREIDLYDQNDDFFQSKDFDEKLIKHNQNAKKIESLLNMSSLSNDHEEIDMADIKEWLNSLTNDQQMFQNMSDETSFSVNSPYALLRRLIQNERDKRIQMNKLKKTTSETELTPFEEMFDKEKENLRVAQYTQTMFTFSKDLYSLQNDVHEKLKAETILQMEAKSTARLENQKKMLEIGLDNKKQTDIRITQQLNEATLLYNHHLKTQNELNAEFHKLENYLLMFQTKMSYDVIEKAKKCNFLENLWVNSKKELRNKIEEIEDQIRVFRNKCDSRNELINQSMKNEAEYRRSHNMYEEMISSLNQDFVSGQYLESNALQILEKDMINAQNIQKALQSKTTQIESKKASTMFSRLFSKYIKEKQSLKTNLEKVLKKSNISFDVAIQSFNEYKIKDKNIFTLSIQQLFDEMKCIITNYQNIFRDQFEAKQIKQENQSKNQHEKLQCKKERIQAKLASSNIELSSNLNSIRLIEGIISDVLQFLQLLYQNEQASKDYSTFMIQINSFLNGAREMNNNLENLFKKFSNDPLHSINLKSLKRSFSCSDLNSSLKQETISKREKVQKENTLHPMCTEEIKNTESIENNKLAVNQKSTINNDLNDQLIEMPHLNPSQHPSPRFMQSRSINDIITIPDDNKQMVYEPQAILPPDSSTNHKKSKRNISNKIKDRSPRFSERRPRHQRNDRQSSQIIEERNAAIRAQAEKSLRHRIEPIPKIPVVKSDDPNVMKEIDAVYSYSSNVFEDQNGKKKKVKTQSKRKRMNRNENEFSCTKSNINITKKNMSLLPFSKREQNVNESNSWYTLKSKKESKIKEETKVTYGVLKFPQTMPKDFFIAANPKLQTNEVKTSNSQTFIFFSHNDKIKQKKLIANFDLMKRRDDGLIHVKSISRSKQ